MEKKIFYNNEDEKRISEKVIKVLENKGFKVATSFRIPAIVAC